MTIQEAIKSEKPFKRSDWGDVTWVPYSLAAAKYFEQSMKTDWEILICERHKWVDKTGWNRTCKECAKELKLDSRYMDKEVKSNFNWEGICTGRLNASQPSIQQLPRNIIEAYGEYDEYLAYPDGEKIETEENKCECGADTAGSGGHSYWCRKH